MSSNQSQNQMNAVLPPSYRSWFEFNLKKEIMVNYPIPNKALTAFILQKIEEHVAHKEKFKASLNKIATE